MLSTLPRTNSPSRTIDIRLPALHATQKRVLTEAQRFNVLCCGRRWGKDTLFLDLAISTALDGDPVGWFNPSYPMLTDVWRTLRSTLYPVIKQINTQQHRIELITGGIIDLWSLDAFDSTRGRKYKRVIINEAAMVPHLQEAWENVIRPTLTDLEGDAFFGSTPRGRTYFFTLYQRGLSGVDGWGAWQFPTSANPYIKPAEIEAARNELPSDVFEQEFDAQFLDSQGAVFRNIHANMTALPTVPAEHEDHTLVAGIDWAQKKDFTVISVGCVECAREVSLDRFNRIDWAFQRERLTTTWQEWGVEWGYAEENSIGGPNIEALQDDDKLDVRPFATTAQSKSQVIKSLALALERTEVAFIDDPVATAELQSYEAHISPVTGHVSYSAPPGSNDDTVIARALMRKAMMDADYGVGVY